MQAWALYKLNQMEEAAALIKTCHQDKTNPFSSQHQLIQFQKFALKLGDDLSAKFITELLCESYLRKNNYSKAIYYQNLVDRKK